MLQDEKQNHWTEFVPNEKSGPCYTYNPIKKSNPGSRYEIKMAFGSVNGLPSSHLMTNI